MGTTALIIFLGTLGMGLLCLALIAWSGLRIYRTLRYAYKDSQPWIERFKDFGDNFAETLKAMEERTRDLAEIGRDMRERVDDIQDAIDELRSRPLLRAARLIGRFRR